MRAIVLVKLLSSHNGLSSSPFEYGEPGGLFEIKDTDLSMEGWDEE